MAQQNLIFFCFKTYLYIRRLVISRIYFIVSVMKQYDARVDVNTPKQILSKKFFVANLARITVVEGLFFLRGYQPILSIAYVS